MTSQIFSVLSRWCLASASLLALALSTNLAQAQDAVDDLASNSAKKTIWHVLNTPNIGLNNFLNSISGLSETDIWAVGTQFPAASALHFDGQTWTTVPIVPTFEINGVAAVAPDNVWAVGDNFTGTHFTPVIQHFDGKQWTVVPSPQFTFGAALKAVAAVSATDIFAVGEFNDDNNGAQTQPLVEHWNGTQWSVVATPFSSQGASLLGIAMVSANDIWSVGLSGILDNQHATTPFAVHFDGTAWKAEPIPSVKNSVFIRLSGVTAVSSNNVWAVGSSQGGQNSKTLIEHWDGVQWKIVPSPNPQSEILPLNALHGVSAVSATDVWAVGCGPCTDFGIGGPPLIEHWDGVSWRISPAPLVGQGDTGSAVLAFPNGSVYMAGTASGSTGGFQTLILHTVH